MVCNKLFANLLFIGTNYAKIVFANPFVNKMFASIYAALSFDNANIKLSNSFQANDKAFAEWTKYHTL